MFVETNSGNAYEVKVEVRKGGVVRMARVVPARSRNCRGKVILATEYEMDLLRQAGRPGLIMGVGFMATDAYQALSQENKESFWSVHGPALRVTLDGTNLRYRNVPTSVRNCLALHNRSLPIRPRPTSRMEVRRLFIALNHGMTSKPVNGDAELHSLLEMLAVGCDVQAEALSGKT